MKIGSWGKVRAFFDLESSDGFTIKGFKIVEAITGLFVGFPSVKDKDGNYNDTIFAGKELKQKVNHLALMEYEARSKDVSADKKTNKELVGSSSNDDDVPF